MKAVKKEVEMFETSDGKVFEEEWAAKNHEKEITEAALRREIVEKFECIKKTLLIFPDSFEPEFETYVYYLTSEEDLQTLKDYLGNKHGEYRDTYHDVEGIKLPWGATPENAFKKWYVDFQGNRWHHSSQSMDRTHELGPLSSVASDAQALLERINTILFDLNGR